MVRRSATAISTKLINAALRLSEPLDGAGKQHLLAGLQNFLQKLALLQGRRYCSLFVLFAIESG
jgi:hypothetical protein